MILVKVNKSANALYVNIPKIILNKTGLKRKDYLIVETNSNGDIIFRRAKITPTHAEPEKPQEKKEEVIEKFYDVQEEKQKIKMPWE